MFSFLSKFQHSQEMRESKDEILVGEIVRLMGKKGILATGFRADSGDQTITFTPTRDSVLYEIRLMIDRKTGGSRMSQAVFGSKAWITFELMIKNLVADPDDLLAMYKTDMQNVFKSPMFGQVKLDHRLNTVVGSKRVMLDIDRYKPQDEPSRQALGQFLMENIGEIREKLLPFKK